MKFGRKFNRESKKNTNKTVFFNMDAPYPDDAISYLDDDEYEGTIVNVIDLEESKCSVILIDVEGVDTIFKTFLNWDMSKNFAWRRPLLEEDILLPSTLKGMGITFTIKNKEANGKIYSNLYSIVLFPPSQGEDGADDDEDILEDE